MTETKNLNRADLSKLWGKILQKGATASQALGNLDTIQFTRLVNSEPITAIAVGSVLAPLKIIALLAKGAEDTTTLHMIADALEASANLPVSEMINNKRMFQYFEFNEATEKMYNELIAFCRN